MAIMEELERWLSCKLILFSWRRDISFLSHRYFSWHSTTFLVSKYINRVMKVRNILCLVSFLCAPVGISPTRTHRDYPLVPAIISTWQNPKLHLKLRLVKLGSYQRAYEHTFAEEGNQRTNKTQQRMMWI